MSKIALLQINTKFVHSSLAAWYIAAGILKFSKISHDVKVIEATINQDISEIFDKITAAQPDIIGISVYIWNTEIVEKLLLMLKEELPDAVLVMGGPEVSYNAEFWLRKGSDYVVKGEGERSFAKLADAIISKKETDNISGLCFLLDGRLEENECGAVNEIPPEPYIPEYFENLNGRISYIETSRGCPFNCTFCLSGCSRLRYFPLDNAKKHIRNLSKSGTQTIKFVNRTFNCNSERAYELFDFVIKLDTSCCFHFEAAADLFDDKTLLLLSNAPAGRIQLEIGLQSFNEKTLNAIHRKTELNKAVENIKKIIGFGNIHTHIDLIAGLPFEDLHSFTESFNRAYSLKAHTLQLGFLKLLHGSEMRKNASEFGIEYEKKAPYEIIRSACLSDKDIILLKKAESALQSTYNKARFLMSIEYVIKKSGISPFDYYLGFGNICEGHGITLENLAEKFFEYCCGLKSVDRNILRDLMVCDWLSSAKGKNLPDFLKVPFDSKKIKQKAEMLHGRKPARGEFAVLISGGREIVVAANCGNKNPVTGLYELLYTE